MHSLPLGYVANVQGDVIDISTHGGRDNNQHSYVRFAVYQLLIPASVPYGAASATWRSISRSGQCVPNALCLPPTSADSVLYATSLTTYDPHFGPAASTLSRAGGAIRSGFSAVNAVMDISFNPISIYNAAKAIYGFITSLLNLGDPHEDDGAVTQISLTRQVQAGDQCPADASSPTNAPPIPVPVDPTCLKLQTTVQYISPGTPDFEHAITIYSVFEQP